MKNYCSSSLYQICLTLFSALDLTSLKGNETEEALEELIELSCFEDHHVAAICVFPEHLSFVEAHLPKADIKLATVANFPAGTASPIELQYELEALFEEAVDEIDLVFPRRALFEGNIEHVTAILNLGRQFALERGLVYKVILESGAFEDKELLYGASRLALEYGADFLKTSTGKFKIGARLEDVRLLCRAILDYEDGMRGIKISGGVRSIEDALLYYTIVEEMMGKDWITKERFRIGASSLAGNLLDFLKQYCDKKSNLDHQKDH